MSAFMGFGTALPEHVIPPEASHAMLGTLWPRLKAAVPGHEVTRYAVEPLERVVERRSIGDAMLLYADHAPRLARLACCRALQAAGVEPGEIDLIISVSCTGYMVPSLDVRLAAEIGLRPGVIRLPITELGCSGGAAAIAAAHRHLSAFPGDRVLVVAVEVPSLSFQPDDRSLDNLTASMVFGDGAAAVVLGGDGEGSPRIVGAGSRLLSASERMLGFDLRDTGFHVVLDRRLPRLIQTGLAEVVDTFRREQGVERFDFYAVHAGGPRIFDAVEVALDLPQGGLADSRRVFSEVGNLSSASILFCLAALRHVTGDGLAIAFGPGVTIEMAHLRR